jgi:uncharacterized repeat protein (TIGR03803 family)
MLYRLPRSAARIGLATAALLGVGTVGATAQSATQPAAIQLATPTALMQFGSAGAPGWQGGVALDGGGNLYVSLSVGTTGAIVQIPRIGVSSAPTVLHSFAGSDGASPSGAPALDAAGNLYGVTSAGGRGFGTVYKLAAKTWALTTLHAFVGGGDGGAPLGGVILYADGNIYGTTSSAGGGFGTVWMLSPTAAGTYSETVLYSFRGGSDGASPSGTLLRDSLGNLFGTTAGGGGTANPGTVFKLAKSGTGYVESVLHRFGASGDGVQPVAGLAMDSNGALYGATYAGGTNARGTVFQATPANTATGLWAWRVLYKFTGGADGSQPIGGVALDTAGNLYGTTNHGGVNTTGAVFKLSPPASPTASWTDTVLYSFPGLTSAAAPGNLPTAGVLRGATGLLYGTTSAGGSTSHTGGVWSLQAQ